MTRRGDWMQTYSGGKFWPLDPRPGDVHLGDIAHALSMLCRYGGHSLRFYSVAEHSVLLSLRVPAEHARWALLHDASEAYLADLVRPLKRHVVGYAEAEAAVMAAIADRFTLRGECPQVVKDYDTRILRDEKAQILAPTDAWSWERDVEPLGVTITGWPPAVAETAFQLRAQQLGIYEMSIEACA